MAEEAVQSVKCDSLESEPEDRQRFLKKNKSPVNQVSRDYITLTQDFNSFYSLPNSLRVSHFLSKIGRRGDSINFKIYLKNSTFCWVFWFKEKSAFKKWSCQRKQTSLGKSQKIPKDRLETNGVFLVGFRFEN